MKRHEKVAAAYAIQIRDALRDGLWVAQRIERFAHGDMTPAESLHLGADLESFRARAADLVGRIDPKRLPGYLLSAEEEEG